MNTRPRRNPTLVCAAVLALSLPCSATAQPLVPTVDLRTPGDTPILSTWAHAYEKAALNVEASDPLDLGCDIYQVSDRTVVALARAVALPPLKSGANHLEIPLPEKSERGKLLFKIISKPTGNPIANLTVNILPADAWISLSKQAHAGNVFIDPSLKAFNSWAASHDIPSTTATPEKPAIYYFGRPTAPPDSPPGRFLIYERDTPDAFPVIEVLAFPGLTKIQLPPGFLANLPNSAPAQALLLKHLNLLP